MLKLRSRSALYIIIFVASLAFLLAACQPETPTTSQKGESTVERTTESTTIPATPTAAPTVTPTPEPTPTPAPVTDPRQLLVLPEELPGYEPPDWHQDGSATKDLDQGRIRWWVFAGDDSVGRTPDIDEPIAFGEQETYTDVDGVLTFRGNHHRDAPSWGTADVAEKKLEIVWTHDIGAISGHNSWWPGSGWTGQPLLVNWPEETRQVMGLFPEMKEKDLVEVIYPVFDGNIYFLDLETGARTRDPISVGYGIKGTGSVDPRGYPLFYTGQGLNDTNGRIGPFRYRIFDLIRNEETFYIAGSDSLAFRSWGAFDASALINWQTDTLIEPGENGIFYRAKLNTAFDPDAGTVSIEPELSRFRYRTEFSSRYGIESSPAMWRNLVYFADNDGAIVCLDINTLEPIWIFNAGDDTDATIVLEETDDGVFLYTGNEIDHRRQSAPSQLRKLDALTGELIWQHDVMCVYDSVLSGGMLATPLLGQDDISDLIIFNISKTTSYTAGLLLALDKESGEVVWERDLDAHSWSSPIAIKGEDGKSYGIFADSAGVMHLFDPRTGIDYSTLSIGANCESSPAAYNNMIVVGTYAQKIYGIRIS